MNKTDFFTDGAAYERLMGRWSRLAGQVFLDWIAVPQGLRWIEIGCGTGAFTEELIKHRLPIELVALDPSPDQIAFARTRSSLAAVKFQTGDAQVLPFDDAVFDVAVMALVIHFLRDPLRGVVEAARVVGPGGWVVSYVWDYAMGGSPTAPVVAALKSLGFGTVSPPSAKATSSSALRDLWLSAKLDDIETRVIPVAVTFADFEEFWHSMTGPVGPVGKTIAEMSPDDVDRLRALLRTRTPTRPDGRVAYPANATAIKGRKRLP
ncbi:MAG: methyltransferase domain-containing protein [Rhizobiales bacterium]|nr:methyltransferase domain-containing protein [Hyphomicrobiales bacterium]